MIKQWIESNPVLKFHRRKLEMEMPSLKYLPALKGGASSSLTCLSVKFARLFPLQFAIKSGQGLQNFGRAVIFE